jgi:autotransporter-associated beta strand protein
LAVSGLLGGMRNRTSQFIGAASIALACASVASAGNNYWSGGSAFNSNWSDSLNWRNVDGPGTTERQDVHFQGASARTTSTVNQDYEVNAIYFDSDSVGVNSAFTINRSNNARIRTVLGVANFTPKTQTVNVPTIALANADIDNEYNNATGGRIYIGDIGTNGFLVTFRPSMNGIIVNGGIYDNGYIAVNGPGTVSPNAQSYWTGGLYLINGEVSYFASNQLGPDSNKIYFANDNGTYSLLSSYVSLTNAHPIDFTANEGRISVDAGNDTVYSGTLSGAGAMAKYGPGILTFTGASTRTGNTYVREGTLKIGAGAALPDTLLDISAGATLTYNGTANDRIGTLNGAGIINLGSDGVWGIGNPDDSTATGNGSGTFSGKINGTTVTINKQGTGTLNLTGNNVVSGYLDMYDGKLFFNNSGSSTSAGGSLTTTVVGGTIGGDGSTDGPIDVYAGGVIDPSSSSVPGVGIGSLSAGIVALRPNSTAKIEVGTGGSDAINSTSAIDLYGGTLALSPVLNVAIADSTRRTILHADGILNGKFGTITGILMTNGRALAVTYDAKNVYVTAAQPGDATLDGKVDFQDLVRLAQNYADTATGRTWSIGDFTGDGKTQFSDLVVLAQNYGFGSVVDGDAGTFGSRFAADWALAQSVVPEPTSLAALGMLLAMSPRRR